MNLNRILVIYDKESPDLSYESLLKKYGVLETKLISLDYKIDNLDILGHMIIIADLDDSLHVKDFLQRVNEHDLKKETIILISSLNINKLQNLKSFLGNINRTIKKPFLNTELTNYIEYKIKQADFLSNRADIFIDIMDMHPSKIAIYDEDGNFFYANMNYIKLYGIDLSNEMDLTFDKIKPCKYEFEYIKSKLLAYKSFNIQKKDDNAWYESIFFYANTKYIIHISSNITVAKQKEIKLELSSNFFENTNDGIIVANKDGLIQSVNRAFSDITGYAKHEVFGKNPRILKSGIHDIAFYESMWSSINTNGYWKGEIWDKRKNGEIYPQILSISKTTNLKYQENCYISIFTDITTLKESDNKIYYHANYDSLTKLPNRSFFKKQLKGLIQQSMQDASQIALFFIDVDKFKDVNDTYGHNVGDQMLITVAKRLLNSVREDDIVSRIGGDEFILVAKNIKDIQSVEKLALKLQKKVKEPLVIEGHVFNITLSMGISIYPQHGITTKELLENADIAMYEVKKKTRNGFKIYDKLMSSRVATKASMLTEVKNALKQNEFVMHYQPIIDFNTNLIVGAEALVRWHHNKVGILQPESFLEFILSGDMDKEFGDMVISNVLKDLTILNKTFLSQKLILSINISRDQFFNPNFCSDVFDLSKKHNIDKAQIELKIVEAQITQNSIVAKEKIESLHLMGFKIVLDDFGIEHSSLNYLKHFKVDKLKIDKSFIKNIMEDENDLNITKSIVNTAKLFNIKVQAEGIETKEQYLKLKNIGCDFSQGFYHSSALPIDDFISYFNKI